MKQKFDKISRFLANAREKMSYESTQEEMIKEFDDGSKLIGPYVDYFQGTKYEYFDKYFVEPDETFEGKESILINGKEKWFRYYSGYFTNKSFIANKKYIFEFLKKGLKEFPKNKPFKRGTNNLKIDDYSYYDECEGTLERFSGKEIILFKKEKIYELNYFGGAKS